MGNKEEYKYIQMKARRKAVCGIKRNGGIIER